MISINIEKEIKQDNRVLGNFTFRQAGCFGIVAVIEVLFYLIVHPGTNNMVAAGLVLGVIAWYFGFHKKDGIYMEYFLWKKVKEYMLRNSSKKYRTKNKYISLMNVSYKSDQNADMANKAAKKEINKQNKQKNKKKKSSKLIAYK